MKTIMNYVVRRFEETCFKKNVHVRFEKCYRHYKCLGKWLETTSKKYF